VVRSAERKSFPKSCPDSAERDGTTRNLVDVEPQTLDAELPIFPAKQAIRAVSLRGFNSRRLHCNSLNSISFIESGAGIYIPAPQGFSRIRSAH
jgi:hypothetical protein